MCPSADLFVYRFVFVFNVLIVILDLITEF